MNKGGKVMNAYEKFDNYLFETGNGFEIVETTSSRSGYPEGLKWALTGFEDWEEAEEAAKALGGEIISLRRRDGQQPWTRDGRVFEPYTRTPESDDEEIWPGGEQSAREYWDGESVALADALQRGELDADGLAAWAAKISKARQEIADADEAQGVVTRRGEFVEVIDLRPMSYHDGDVTAYQIAVICG